MDTTTIPIITLIVIIIGAIMGIYQLCLISKQIKAQHDWNRRSTSLNFSFSDDPHIREIRSKLDEHLNIMSRRQGEISLEDIDNLSEGQYPHIRTDIQFMLGRLEMMCIAMNNYVADEQVCKDMLKGVVILYYRFFSQYIEDTRVSRNNQKIYENLESYARKWDETNNIMDRRPPTA